MGFQIPFDLEQAADINFALNHLDMVVLDEASLISPHTFSLVASTLNLLNSCPVVLIAGDKLSPATTADGGQQGLQHHVHPQWWHLQQQQLREAHLTPAVQSARSRLRPLLGSHPLHAAHTSSTGQVSGGGHPLPIQSPGRWGDLSLQSVGENIGHDHLTHFSTTGQQHHGGQTVQGPMTPQPGPLLCSRHENHHHQKLRQELQDCEWTGCNLHPQPRDSLVIQFPDNEQAFLYPVTHAVEGEGNITRYPFTPAYARTICKSQGQNLKHLLLWLDCPTVPPGLTYIALSPVCKKTDLTVLQLMDTSQLMPVGCRPDQHWIHSLSLVSSIHLFDGALFSFPCMQATGCSANA